MKKIIPADSTLIPAEATRVFKGQIFDTYQWPQKLFDGSEHTFEMLKRADTVSVIGIVEDKIIIIDDEQPHLGSRISFPGGRVDADDSSPLAAAQREYIEEIGYQFNNWRLVKVHQPYRKMEWFIYVYLAWDVKGQTEPTPDAGEKIVPKQVNLAELKDLIDQKTDYLAESSDLFEGIDTIDQLLNLPEFQGREVDR